MTGSTTRNAWQRDMHHCRVLAARMLSEMQDLLREEVKDEEKTPVKLKGIGNRELILDMWCKVVSHLCKLHALDAERGGQQAAEPLRELEPHEVKMMRQYLDGL